MYSVKNIVRLLSPSPVKLVLAETWYGVRIVGDGWRFVDEDVGVYRRYRVELAIGRPAPHYPVQVFHGERLAEVGFTDDKGYFEYTFDRSGKWKVLAGPRGVAEMLGIEDFFKVFKYAEKVPLVGEVVFYRENVGKVDDRIGGIVKFRRGEMYEYDTGVGDIVRAVAEKLYREISKKFKVDKKAVIENVDKLLRKHIESAIVHFLKVRWSWLWRAHARYWCRYRVTRGRVAGKVADVSKTISFTVAGKTVNVTVSGQVVAEMTYDVSVDWYWRERPYWTHGFVIGHFCVNVKIDKLYTAAMAHKLDLAVETLVADDQPTREFKIAIDGADRCSIGGTPKCRAKLKIGPTGIRIV